MRKRRLTQLELGNALGISHTSVGRWLSGSVPHKRTVAQVATYFGVRVEDLLDDSREIADSTETTLLAESQAEYRVATTPTKTAAALARREHGDTPAGQSAFAMHLTNLRSMRDEAERQNPHDVRAIERQFDTLLASYIAALDTRIKPHLTP